MMAAKHQEQELKLAAQQALHEEQRLQAEKEADSDPTPAVEEEIAPSAAEGVLHKSVVLILFVVLLASSCCFLVVISVPMLRLTLAASHSHCPYSHCPSQPLVLMITCRIHFITKSGCL